MKKYWFLGLIILQSCSHFYMPMPAMDLNSKAQVNIFKPHRDFPVIAGDEDMEWEKPVQYLDNLKNYRQPSSLVEKKTVRIPPPEEIQPEIITPPVTIEVPDYFRAPKTPSIGMGMDKNEVVDQLGHPVKVEIAGSPENENERWGYLANGAMKYIYFESGQVKGWE